MRSVSSRFKYPVQRGDWEDIGRSISEPLTTLNQSWVATWVEMREDEIGDINKVKASGRIGNIAFSATLITPFA